LQPEHRFQPIGQQHVYYAKPLHHHYPLPAIFTHLGFQQNGWRGIHPKLMIMKTRTFQLIAGLFVWVLCAQSVQAQYARFVESGVIEFEKRVNMYAKIKDRIGESSFMEQVFEQYQRANPQFKAFKYNLAFSGTKTRFWPQDSPAGASGGGFFGNDPSIDLGNIIAADLLAQQGISQKSIY